MKRTAITSLVLCAMSGFAQPYGQTYYSSSADLQAGARTGINTAGDGFIMIGMKGTDIHVEKTTAGGAVPSSFSALSFERDYTVYQTGGGCLPSSGAVSTCSGANIIEITPSTANNAWFAMAGSYANACFLTFLTPDGVPIYTRS